MALLAITALFAMVLGWVFRTYLRRRDPLLRDVMLMLAAVAMLFVVGVIRLFAGQPPTVVIVLALMVLLAKPFFTLRLACQLRPVPRAWLRLALAAWLLSALPVVAAATGPMPGPAAWPAVALFFLGETAAACLLGMEARRRGGAARIRLWCAALGTGLFGLGLLSSAGGHTANVGARILALLSGLLYLFAFVPPRWLRRSWSLDAAYTVTRQLIAAPPEEPAWQTWQRYYEGAGRALGADTVLLLLPETPGHVQVVTHANHPLANHRYSDRDLDEMLASTMTIDALAGWTHPPRIPAELATATATRFVTAAPVNVPGGRGALVVLSRYRTLFADDDIALFTELAGQATALAQRATALADQQNLAAIVESSHDAIIAKTLNGTITSWNTGAERLYGYQADEILGRSAEILFPDGQQQTEAALMDRIARGERVDQNQVQRRHKDGATISVSLTLSPITDAAGQITGVASISRDISERQRAEAMFRGLLEAAPDAIVGVTTDGTITLINAQTVKLFGYQRDELLGQSVDILVPERLRERHPQQRSRYFAHPRTRPMGAGAALAAVRKDGSEFPAEISLSSLETDDGIIVSAAIRDVTERLIAQAERERLITQAERDASERRLQHARRLESLGQLAGGVAHDFNNILAVVANYTELLIETLENPSVDAEDLAAARNDLGQIARAAERATRLTKQLLAFGRRDITQAEVLGLNHVIGDVEQMLRRTIGEHIHLITQLDQQLWPVYADASQVEQILVNLAVNARDAMPSGGTLSIDTGNANLEPEDTSGNNLAPGRYVRLRVSDTGTGMPRDVIERAFEPFYTTKPQGSGTGLGLATVYGIATAAGGDVHLYSEADIGTTVTIWLPAVDTSAETTEATTVTPTEVAEKQPPNETILLVEDEDALRQVASRILTRAGYRVLAANGGAQALHIAQTHPAPIDLLLTDVVMPKMLGNEVAARVRAIHPGLPVLYMSGYAQPVLTENGTLPTGVTIVEKPFTSREVLDSVHAVLHLPAARSLRNRQGADEPAERAPIAG
jgi:PAS domain S-box-containing protein